MNIYTSGYDMSTNDVIDWLYFLDPECSLARYNDYKIPEQISIELGSSNQHKEKSWYRRGYIFNPVQNRSELSCELETIRNSYDTENHFVYQALTNLIFNPYNSINAYKDNDTNKITNLSLAEQNGIIIPKTFVSNHIPGINNFLNCSEEYIIKDIALDPLKICKYNYSFNVGLVPQKLSGAAIKQKLSLFAPDHKYGFLFIQKYIEKRVELRIFYLRGTFYTMAICSQNNQKTRIDYRNYDEQHPNRCIPFLLPDEEQVKLDKLMKAIGLNCGSIDMIYTPDGKYVFLEVNPIGQFQWLSKNCNYDIERSIAGFLLY